MDSAAATSALNGLLRGLIRRGREPKALALFERETRRDRGTYVAAMAAAWQLAVKSKWKLEPEVAGRILFAKEVKDGWAGGSGFRWEDATVVKKRKGTKPWIVGENGGHLGGAGGNVVGSGDGDEPTEATDTTPPHKLIQPDRLIRPDDALLELKPRKTRIQFGIRENEFVHTIRYVVNEMLVDFHEKNNPEAKMSIEFLDLVMDDGRGVGASLAEAVSRSGKPLSSKAFLYLMHRAAALGDATLAMDLLRAMKERQVPRTPTHYAVIANCLIVREFTNRGQRPTVYQTHFALLEEEFKTEKGFDGFDPEYLSRLVEGYAVVRDIENLKVDDFEFSTKTSMDLLLAALTKTMHAKVPLTDRLYGLAIRKLKITALSLEYAKCVTFAMNMMDIPRGTHVDNACLEAYLYAVQRDVKSKSLSAAAALPAALAASPSLKTIKAIQPEAVWNLTREQAESTTWADYSQSVLAINLSPKSRLDLIILFAENLFLEMLSLDNLKTSRVYGVFQDRNVLVGQVGNVNDIFNVCQMAPRLVARGREKMLTMESFNLLASIYCISGKVDSLERLIQATAPPVQEDNGSAGDEYDLPVGLVDMTKLYALLIRAYGLAGKRDLAVEVVGDMQSAGLSIDVTALDSLVSALTFKKSRPRAGAAGEAMGHTVALLDRFKLTPYRETLVKLHSCAKDENDPDEVERVLGLFERFGFAMPAGV